jgi:hypothetical protein
VDTGCGVHVYRLLDAWVHRIVNVAQRPSEVHETLLWEWALHYAFVADRTALRPPEIGIDLRDLSRVMMVSRVLRPTSVGYRLAARIRIDGGTLIDVCPARVSNISTATFLVGQHRDWLSEGDCAALRGLCDVHSASDCPSRVKGAIVLHEFASHTGALNLRWPIICTALEAFAVPYEGDGIQGKRLGSGARFVGALLLLSEVLGDQPWSVDDAWSVWRRRSRLVHTGFVPLTDEPPPVDTLLARLEVTLRAALVNALGRGALLNLVRDEKLLAEAVAKRANLARSARSKRG